MAARRPAPGSAVQPRGDLLDAHSSPQGHRRGAEAPLPIWYLDLANLLQQEGKEEKGHLEHTLHLIQDLHDLHLQLLKLPAGEHYRQTYAKLEPELPRLRAVLGNPGMSDTELCFRALYAAMLYRIKGEGDKSAVTDTLEFISPVIAELADIHGKVERGEIDLFKAGDGKAQK